MRFVRGFFWLVLILQLAHAKGSADLIVCGMEKVFIISAEGGESPRWEWTAELSAEIPESMRGAFATTDDCKPYRGYLLITSSSGGVALVERETRKCSFFTKVRNAHSACLVPGNLVAVASSFGGDQLVIFSLGKSGSQVAPEMRLPLYGAHGVEWDWRRECLWALGTEVLLKIEINDAKAVVVEEFKLPTPGGHDLTWWSASELVLSVDRHCYLFSVTENKFNRFLPLADEVKVKSIHRSRKTGKLVWHRGAKETWWSDTIRFAQPKENRALEGERIYKVRWDEPRVRPLESSEIIDPSVQPQRGISGNGGYVERSRIIVDLDGDGMEDTLLSGGPEEFGTMGGPWSVLLRRENGFVRVGEVWAHPAAISFEEDQSRISEDFTTRRYTRIWAYLKSSGRAGSLGYYRVGDSIVDELQGIEIYPGDGGTNLGNALFGEAFRESSIPFRRERSLTTVTGQVTWQ
jgi:hypothetical protein